MRISVKSRHLEFHHSLNLICQVLFDLFTEPKMKNYTSKFIFVMNLIFSSHALSAFNDVADQYIEVNISYDRSTGLFYDLDASGSQLIEFTLIESGETPVFKLKHGRDGYIGAVVTSNHTVRYNSRAAEETHFSRLTADRSSYNLLMDVGKGDTMLWMPPFVRRWHVTDQSGCSAATTTSTLNVASQMKVTDLNGIFSYHWCLSHYFEISPSTYPSDINQVGYIDRYFRFARSELEGAPFDTYTSSFSVITTEMMRLGDTQKGREAYHYTVNLYVKPNIQQFDIDQSTLDFNVRRVSGKIIGEAHTGFTASGSFDKYQPFTVTATSLNACGSSLCLMNVSSSIPYEVEVFDPVTLLKKKITTSGASVSINADREHEMNGTLGFKFNVTDDGQSGVYSDVVTVRLALVL